MLFVGEGSANGREQVRPGNPRGRPGLIEPGNGGFQLLVVGGGSCLQLIEFRVAKNFPPFALWQMGGRGGFAPGDSFESITFDDKTFQASVALQLQQKFQFPKDSSAKILTSGLLGEQYVGIEPGGNEKNLAAGDVITQTQSAVVLENLISQFLFNKASEGAPAARATEGLVVRW